MNDKVNTFQGLNATSPRENLEKQNCQKHAEHAIPQQNIIPQQKSANETRTSPNNDIWQQVSLSRNDRREHLKEATGPYGLSKSDVHPAQSQDKPNHENTIQKKFILGPHNTRGSKGDHAIMQAMEEKAELIWEAYRSTIKEKIAPTYYVEFPDDDDEEGKRKNHEAIEIFLAKEIHKTLTLKRTRTETGANLLKLHEESEEDNAQEVDTEEEQLNTKKKKFRRIATTNEENHSLYTYMAEEAGLIKPHKSP